MERLRRMVLFKSLRHELRPVTKLYWRPLSSFNGARTFSAHIYSDLRGGRCVGLQAGSDQIVLKVPKNEHCWVSLLHRSQSHSVTVRFFIKICRNHRPLPELSVPATHLPSDGLYPSLTTPHTSPSNRHFSRYYPHF